MIIRTAQFMGTVASGDQTKFNETVDQKVLPILRQLPKILQAEVLRPITSDPGAPALYQVLQLRFPNVAAMEEALESPNRAKVHEIMSEVLPLFEGEIFHYVSHVAE
jgi:hypothetical protein